MKNNKRAAMEMTMGTVVTIVLLIAVLVMVLFFINQIREGGENAIDSVTKQIESEIDKIFSSDQTKRMVIYPATRQITIKKGTDNQKGFAFSIRNIEETGGTFSYEITASETDCGMTLPNADSLLGLGKQKSNIYIASGSIMDYPEMVKFKIPSETPLCEISYSIGLKKDNAHYGTPVSVHVKILSA
ncbi:hypothetical protein ACFLZJ_01030 [Nanoarchaeota archaeon]